MGNWKSDETVSAHISECGLYRYRLEVRWGPGRIVAVIGLNPSKADLSRDDNTVRKCINWARRNGYDALLMLNLFAFRATNPKDMKAAWNAFGDQQPEDLAKLCAGVDTVIAGWGGHGSHHGRDVEVRRVLKSAGIPLWTWAINKDWTPAHPCYLSLGEVKPWQ